MIALIQRVRSAKVTVNNQVIGKINKGLLVFLAVEPEDTEQKTQRLSERVVGYRVFADSQGKMNINVKQAGGDLLVVSQFTLAANTSKGLRPGFSNAAAPDFSRHLYEYFCQTIRNQGFRVPMGEFGADMQVELINDGPATFTLKG